MKAAVPCGAGASVLGAQTPSANSPLAFRSLLSPFTWHLLPEAPLLLCIQKPTERNLIGQSGLPDWPELLFSATSKAADEVMGGLVSGAQSVESRAYKSRRCALSHLG